MSKSGRWVVEPGTGNLIDWTKYYAQKAAERNPAAYFVPDLKSFISPLDGKEISSRSQLREHEARHNVRQVGNDLKLPDYDAASVRKRAPQSDRAMSAAFHTALQKAGLS